ncbi:hypothetical protein CHU95_21130 [Niveispirillum lacus]|uniref:AB hydrolase-1 domain-containing protein n=1 Tax=Niveispirillum lacus TaxID=1981099 RepID=A0A255YR18_9PROT|nr:alpha/beta fold hydrolase [Niveispirillum lacus]OYQ31642.1 hypothetical protein CHU95_21130 [Niveispirillum lacus]
MIERHFITVEGRLVHYRRTGNGPAVVALHQSPRDSAELVPLMRALAPYATVIAPDHPGFGLSDPLPDGPACIDRFAQAMVDLLQALGLEKAAFYGFHTGACIANRVAALYPDRVTGVVVDGFMVMGQEEREDFLAHYLPPFQPQWDGGHLAWAWHRIRDQGIFFPWYRREPSARLARPKPDLARMHAQVMELMRAGDPYRVGYAAALSYCPTEDMASLSVPALLFIAQDDPLVRYLSKVPPLPDGVAVATASDRSAAYGVITDFLRQHMPDVAAPPAPACDACGVTNGMAWRAGGQGEPLLRLHDLGGAGALLPAPAQGAWLAPDLPGMGDSDLAAEPGDLTAVADAVAGLLTARGWSGGAVEGWGYGGRVAQVLAKRHPGQVSGLTLHPGHTTAPPDLRPVEGGGHLLAAWQQARDAHLFAPGDGLLPDPARLQAETWYWLKAAPILDRAWRAMASGD